MDISREANMFSDLDAKELIQEMGSPSNVLQLLHSSLERTVNCEPTTVNGYK